MYRRFLKPLLDFFIAFTALLVLSPLLIPITLLLALANRGKPFFFQQRPGRNEQLFNIIKFKTMTDERDSKGALLSDEKRLTAVGSFVRKTSIDELPQLWNVLKGEMSLIGPRPFLPAYLPLYNDYQKKRHEVKPGITGWAQVNGRNAINWDEKFEFDVWYVENISFFLDLKIIFKTIKKVVISEGINTANMATTEPFNGNNYELMEKIILFGASDYCRYTIDIIEQEGKYEIAGILDKNLSVGEKFAGYKILGYLDDLQKLIQDLQLIGGVIAIGDNFTRKKVKQEIVKKVINFSFVNAIHPSVIIGKEVNIGEGCVFMAGVIVNNNCTIGEHCFLATKSSLDHDSTIGDFSSMSPGATTGGRVKIGSCTAIGIGASILHYKRIGNYCVIGGNSLVNKDIEDYYLAFGVPAKPVKKRAPEEKYL